MILLSTPSQVVTAAAMKRLDSLIFKISAEVLLALVKADLIPQLINTLNPQSLSFDEAVDIHTDLMSSTMSSLWLATPDGLTELGIEDGNEQQAVRETVLKQVIVPSEKYICHLCVIRYSIVDGDQSYEFMLLHSTLLEISPYYQPTMDVVLHMPVVLTIPSSLTFFEVDRSIFWFLSNMIDTQREWNNQGGKERQLWKTVHRMLRMEGIEDVIEEKLRNAKGGYFGDPWFTETIGILSRQSRSMVATLSFSFTATLALLVSVTLLELCRLERGNRKDCAYDYKSEMNSNGEENRLDDLWLSCMCSVDGFRLKQFRTNFWCSDSLNQNGMICTIPSDRPFLNPPHPPSPQNRPCRSRPLPIWMKTIEIEREERDPVLVCTDLSETNQSILTIHCVILASEYSPDRNLAVHTPFSFAASAFPKTQLVSLLAGSSWGMGLPGWPRWIGTRFGRCGHRKASELDRNSSDAKYEVQPANGRI
ncbi:hypothetical protein BLNAU_12120 [Blattamonas nauphoetae]|uniref:Uncharacterized protein n=1 Tax=Blattamonas nauphoetae TaxID=2049346 RepID=A0ABQ9XQ66_9EUKA|nr:hypothetical protein BLNAU_12120 [Blattamonas nauphoetae]